MKDILKSSIVATFCLLFIIVLLLFSSCKTQKETVTVETIRTIENRDTVIQIQEDTATRQLLILCDSAYNAYVAGDTLKNGKHVKIVYKFVDKVLNITAPVDSFKINAELMYLKESVKLSKEHAIIQKKLINFWAIAFWAVLFIFVVENLVFLIISIKR